MSELKITKGGDWYHEEGTLSIWHPTQVGVRLCVVDKTYNAGTFGSENEESKANAILIADAGTTYNKCSLLPSELFERNNELLEALKSAVNLVKTTDEFEILVDYQIKIKSLEELINKSTL